MQHILQHYEQMPPVTRVYMTACVLTTLAVVSLRGSSANLFQQFEFVTPFHLYFNWHLIAYHFQAGV